MYPNYPRDPETQMLDTLSRAVEGDMAHTRLLSGTVVVQCSANAISTANIPFSQQFTDIPQISFSLKSIGDINSIVKWSDIGSVDTKGFTIRVMTDTSQSLTFTWSAYGNAG